MLSSKIFKEQFLSAVIFSGELRLEIYCFGAHVGHEIHERETARF